MYKKGLISVAYVAHDLTTKLKFLLVLTVENVLATKSMKILGTDGKEKWEIYRYLLQFMAKIIQLLSLT